MLQIFAIINASSVMYSGKKAQHDFPKMRGGGGSKGVWNFSENSSNMVEIVTPNTHVCFLVNLVLL